jgi:cytochrome c553
MPRIISFSLFLLLGLGGSVMYSCQSTKKEKKNTEQLQTLDSSKTWTEVSSSLSGSCSGAGCHNATGDSKEPKFTAAGFQAAYDKVLFRVKAKDATVMPPTSSGKPVLTPAQIAVLEGWKLGGFKTSSNTTTTGITWEGNLKSTFQGSCEKSGCHSSTSVVNKIQISYSDIKAKYDTVLRRLEATDGTRMPPSEALAASKIQEFKDWKTNNYAEKASGNTTDTEKVTWTDHIETILEKNCGSCHNEGGDNEVAFTVTYAGIRGAKQKYQKIWDAVSKEPDEELFMPKGKSKLSQEDLDKLQKWKDGGFLEDRYSGGGGSGDTGTYDCSAPYGTSGTVEFENDIEEPLNALCEDCHKAGESNDFYETSYLYTAKNVGAVIKSLKDGRMPKGPPAGFEEADRDDLLQLLKDWASDNCPR